MRLNVRHVQVRAPLRGLGGGVVALAHERIGVDEKARILSTHLGFEAVLGVERHALPELREVPHREIVVGPNRVLKFRGF